MRSTAKTAARTAERENAQKHLARFAALVAMIVIWGIVVYAR